MLYRRRKANIMPTVVKERAFTSFSMAIARYFLTVLGLSRISHTNKIECTSLEKHVTRSNYNRLSV